MDAERIRALCRGAEAELIRLRRELHMIPEIGTELPETRAVVLRELEAAGVEYVLSTADSAVMAVVKGRGEGRVLAFRADMDALPLQEETGLDFASRKAGCMHACGHDAHTAMMLVTAKLLKDCRDSFSGEVRLIFQTGEETSEGAVNVVKQGWLDGVDAAFCVHIGPVEDDIPSGAFVVLPGRCLASVDRFVIRVKGRGCHCSMPHKGVDPIVAASQVVLGLQNILSREVPASETAVLSIGRINGGQVFNAIPDSVVLEGSVRTHNECVRRRMAERVAEISRGIAQAYGADADTEIFWGTPPIVNCAEAAEKAAGAAASVVGRDLVCSRLPAPKMGGDDFAYYLEKVPGAYVFLSSHGAGAPIHSSRFNIDEDLLWTGPAFFISLTAKYMSGN